MVMIMKNNKLTNKQESILIFIKKYIAKNGYSPTVREIAKAVNLSSPATVHAHLSNLIEKGFIKRNKKNNRIIELLVPNEFQSITSGEISIPFIQNGKEMSVYKTYKTIASKYKELIAFKMDNNIMKNKGIFKGDILFFEVGCNVSSDDIILVNIDNNYLVTDVNNGKVKVIGKLIKLYREY